MRSITPLSGGPPAEVPLPSAPLVRVIAQARFAPILAIRNPDNVASFQEAIRATYPVLQEEPFQHMVIGPLGAPAAREGVIWRFGDREKQSQWRVSLSVDFVALETSAYASRADFVSRFEQVVQALELSFKPAHCQRLGIRYVDRMKGEAIARIAELISPQILGIALPNDEPPLSLGDAVLHLMTEAALAAQEGQITARWGSLPHNATHDPNALEPIDEPSWILDLDMFTTAPVPFQSEVLASTAKAFAERIYAVFREMVTDEFLRFYGGKP